MLNAKRNSYDGQAEDCSECQVHETDLNSAYKDPDYVHQDEYWYLLVDGEKFELEGWIMGYNALKTKLKLDCCVGCG